MKNEPAVEAQGVLDFWYGEPTPEQWWKRNRVKMSTGRGRA